MLSFFRNDWHKFHSVTNIFWMRYLADKMLKMKSFPSKRGTSPTVTQFKKLLIGFLQRSKSYHSAVQMVFTDEIFTKYTECVECVSDWSGKLAVPCISLNLFTGKVAKPLHFTCWIFSSCAHLIYAQFCILCQRVRITCRYLYIPV